MRLTPEQVIQQRAKTHGDYAMQSRSAQAIKRIMRRLPNWELMDDRQRESLDLIATKISRIGHGDPNHADTWLDIAGYAMLICQEEPAS